MEKLVAPDDQMTLPLHQHSLGVESMCYSPYTTPVEKNAVERYEVVEKNLYFLTKKLTFPPDESAPMAKEREGT